MQFLLPPNKLAKNELLAPALRNIAPAKTKTKCLPYFVSSKIQIFLPLRKSFFLFFQGHRFI